MRRIIFCALVLVGATGCPYANPHTRVSFDPIWHTVDFYDSKDNDLEIDGLKVDPASKVITLDKLTIRNNASDVRKANVDQIKAQTEQVQAITQMVTMQTQMLTGMMQRLAPFLFPATSVDLTTPWGGVKGGTTPVPTTQPGGAP